MPQVHTASLLGSKAYGFRSAVPPILPRQSVLLRDITGREMIFPQYLQDTLFGTCKVSRKASSTGSRASPSAFPTGSSPKVCSFKDTKLGFIPLWFPGFFLASSDQTSITSLFFFLILTLEEFVSSELELRQRRQKARHKGTCEHFLWALLKLLATFLSHH